jgi:hypothetical protein
MTNYRSLVRFAAVLAAACVPALAQVKTVTPEPSLMVLTAAGVGAVILIARKARRR